MILAEDIFGNKCFFMVMHMMLVMMHLMRCYHFRLQMHFVTHTLFLFLTTTALFFILFFCCFHRNTTGRNSVYRILFRCSGIFIRKSSIVLWFFGNQPAIKFLLC